jgi:erythronate-4-phosphate dehydrogenase
MEMIKIVADENIEFVKEAFSGFGTLTVLPGRKISKNDLLGADVLLVRSVTQVNESLLAGTKVKFVGTATIGSDHIDKDYLTSNNLFFTDAAGCNSEAVKEYVFTALYQIAEEQKLTLKNKTMGIVGVGNIGSRVARTANTLGVKVLKNDPPLKRKSNSPEYVELDELMQADIITIHAPLIKQGIDKTHHLFDEARLNKLKDGTILINSSRGSVIDNDALAKIISQKRLSVILDVWENEPNISQELLEEVKIATPHIAGYSLEGKVNGTVILYKALCNYLKISSSWSPQLPAVIDKITISNSELQQSLQKVFFSIFNIKKDDSGIRKINKFDGKERGNYFDSLRKNYLLRREFTNYKVRLDSNNKELEEILNTLRFNVEK